jgi:hypothetical protein
MGCSGGKLSKVGPFCVLIEKRRPISSLSPRRIGHHVLLDNMERVQKCRSTLRPQTHLPPAPTRGFNNAIALCHQQRVLKRAKSVESKNRAGLIDLAYRIGIKSANKLLVNYLTGAIHRTLDTTLFQTVIDSRSCQSSEPRDRI